MFSNALNELLGVEPHLAITYFMCVAIGVVINWAKKCRELNIGLLNYWTRHPIRSQTALLGTISAFIFTVVTDPESGKLTYMAIGYACDNLLNKADPNPSAALEIAKQEASNAVSEQKAREQVIVRDHSPA